MRLLAQARPASTTATTVLTKAARVNNVAIETIVVCNNTASELTYRLFHPFSESATYDQSTALCYDTPIAANRTVVFEIAITLTDDAPYLGVRSSSANGLTFSVYGEK